MKIIKLKAGLGNMMFQYALGRMLEKAYGIKDIVFDTSYYSFAKYSNILERFNSFNVKYVTASKKELTKSLLLKRFFTPKPYTFLFRATVAFESTFNKKYFLEKNHVFIKPDTLLKYQYIDGYWQSWKYVDCIRDLLIEDFKPKNIENGIYQMLLSDIQKSNAVALCIRKGDYLSSNRTKSRFYNCSIEYYQRAIEYISLNVEKPVFYVFTNDERWVKENVCFPKGVSFVFRKNDEILPDFLELQLIASCKHFIISNSTFHWWGAWLSENDEKIIIRPKLWFSDGTEIDIYPPSWVNLNL